VFDKNRSFVAWAIGIAKNEIHTHHRKKGKQGLSLDISVEIRVLQAYHVMNGWLVVKTGIDSYNNAPMDSNHPNKQDLVVLRRLSFGIF
jgi:DNA-directed RNA polymerase specialized sigma24 family protein